MENISWNQFTLWFISDLTVIGGSIAVGVAVIVAFYVFRRQT